MKCQTGTIINQKLQKVLSKNYDFQIVCNILKILRGEEVNVSNLNIQVISSDKAYLK